MTDPGVEGPVWVPTAPPSLEAFLAPTLQPIPLIPAIAALLALLYLSGAIKLWLTHRRWPIWRTVTFLVACVIIMVVMGAGVEGYGLRMFSVFMFQQLTLMMAVPPLLILGRPGTLLLRATPHSGLGRIVLRVAHAGLKARLSRIVLHPGFMIPVFLMSFYGIYFSDLANTLLPTWYGHVGLELLFLISGIIFTVPLMSTDPLPAKQSHFGRLIDVFAEMPLHAFFGVIVMMATVPMVDFFANPPPAWNVDPLADQVLAGGLAWSYGELPSVLMLMFILVRWQRDDAVTSKAKDREEQTDGTPELDAYNDYLHQLRQRAERY
ncbi:cytochrome c oxidase assembly protein [Arthrobacter sp. 260]|uniref:cytochrome c oxidase assembly protein n=1 Tax=Arthrobacter sp. 260 TaxID=2735314 RepID=UPI001491CFF9|nr:cytochrome c oxidase assembly protein [Arthrobacter sp. 260]NOJ61595.1 cytochrome c oxidase assembly protein [Arthrobacter sp. 260]